MPVHSSLRPLGSPISDISGRIRFTFSVGSSCIMLFSSKLQENKWINTICWVFPWDLWIYRQRYLKYSQLKGRSTPIFCEMQKHFQTCKASTVMERPQTFPLWNLCWVLILVQIFTTWERGSDPKAQMKTSLSFVGPWTSWAEHHIFTSPSLSNSSQSSCLALDSL